MRIPQLFTIALVAVALTACGDDDDGGGGDIADANAVIDAPAAADAGPADADDTQVCYPTGIYGICDDLGCPFCLATTPPFYESCSKTCTETTECGDPGDFAGATPLCAPINIGATDKICVLTCTADEQCPCGLPCIESGVPGTRICAKPV